MANEKRLIDANALLPEMERRFCDNCYWHDGKCKECQYAEAVDMMVDAPTVDAVEVVRCKDCKHIETIENSIPYCTLHCSGCGYDDFCSYGERREA